MSHTSRIPAPRRAMVTLSLAALMSAGTPLFAQQSGLQTAPRQQGTTQQTPQPPAGPTLEVSMDQAVAMALETNLDLKANRFNLSMSAQGVAAARAAYLPVLTGSASRTSRTSVTSNQFESDQSTTRRTTLSTGSRISQNLPWYGSNVNVSWSAGRDFTTAFTNFNPTLSSGLTINFSQPLWQRLLIDNTRYSIQNAERGYRITDLQVQQQVYLTQDSVRLAYLNLVGAVANLGVTRDNRDVNEVSLRNARSRIAVGQAAEIDAIQSEAALRTSEEAVIIAEAALAQAEDQLRQLILDPARPDYWQVHLVATDSIEVTPKAIDLDAAIKTALANRIDLTIARQQVDQTQLAYKLSQDATKPSVDLGLTYGASGVAGTLIDPETRTPLSSLGFGQAFSDAFGNRNPVWTVGLNVAYPLGQTAARAQVARTEMQIEQQQLNLRSQEFAVISQVRDAARRVESGYRRVQSTQLALAANEQQLNAETRKQEVGMSTQFDVLLKQQFLASARSAELAARIAYAQALINFERVQHIR